VRITHAARNAITQHVRAPSFFQRGRHAVLITFARTAIAEIVNCAINAAERKRGAEIPSRGDVPHVDLKPGGKVLGLFISPVQTGIENAISRM